MTRRSILRALAGAVLGLVTVLPLAAQDTQRVRLLRQEIEQRFATQLRQELGLSEEQEGKVRGILATYGERRRGLEVREQMLRRALAGQLRPGIAARPDSVDRLVDGIGALRVVHAQTLQEELRELATILTPVQRGQLFLLRDRLLQRAQEVRDARMRAGRMPPR